MEIQTFLFSFSHVSPFFYFSFTPLLLCYFVFEHVSGSGLLSDWNRCCAWIVVALFWCDCNSMCEYVQRLWWKWVFFPSGFSSLWFGLKGAEVVSSPPCLSVDGPSSRLQIVPCVGVDTSAWVNTYRPNHSVLYGSEVMVSWLFDHWLFWDADVPFMRNESHLFSLKSQKNTIWY